MVMGRHSGQAINTAKDSKWSDQEDFISEKF